MACTGKGEKSKIISNVLKNKIAVDRWRRCSVLVVDEVSMLDRALFELLDEIARLLRHSDAPFGGIQVVAVGDFMQLPPVRKESEGHFCFQSPVWAAAGLSEGVINLQRVERQSDPVFIQHLNEVRLGKLTPAFSELLRSCLVGRKPLPSNGIIPTKLYAVNREVDSENTDRLAELSGDVVTMVAEDHWEAKPRQAALAPGIRLGIQNTIPDRIDLKVGAQVMLLRNRHFNSGTPSALQLVNGSRGQVVGFSESVVRPGQLIPTVRFDNGLTTAIGPVNFTLKGPGGDGCIVRSQIPLKLAW